MGVYILEVVELPRHGESHDEERGEDDVNDGHGKDLQVGSRGIGRKGRGGR